jgi:hypothetical protein
MPVLLRNCDKNKEFFIELGDGSGKEGVYAVVLPSSERDKLRDKYTKQTASRNGPKEVFDASGFILERMQLSIKRWVGFTDLDGKEIPCTKETIAECLDLNPTIFLDIAAQLDSLAENGRAAIEKNSKSGPQ